VGRKVVRIYPTIIEKFISGGHMESIPGFHSWDTAGQVSGYKRISKILQTSSRLHDTRYWYQAERFSGWFGQQALARRILPYHPPLLLGMASNGDG
jgi:hypothetical protein